MLPDTQRMEGWGWGGCSLTAGLENHEREVVVQLAFHDFVARQLDRFGEFSIELPFLPVVNGGALLQGAKRLDQRERHSSCFPADRKVNHGACSLRAIKFVSRDLKRPKTVTLGASRAVRRVVGCIRRDGPCCRGCRRRCSLAVRTAAALARGRQVEAG